MKTLLSQCMKKIKRKRCVGLSLQAQTEGLVKSPDVSVTTFHMVRTITEARESPDRMLCSRKNK